ncbi:MAG: flagellar hook-length control protein FliK [Nitrospirae bacterium]|nr:flagellar hook-length control protein FliK [Nitrospirota bacterium]
MSEILQISAADIVQSRPRADAKEITLMRPIANDPKKDPSAYRLNLSAQKDPRPVGTRQNADKSSESTRSNSRQDGSAREARDVQASSDSDTRRSDASDAAKDKKQFNSVLDKLMKDDNTNATTNEATAASAAAAGVVILQPDAVSDTVLGGLKPAGFNNANNNNIAAALLGVQTSPDANNLRQAAPQPGIEVAAQKPGDTEIKAPELNESDKKTSNNNSHEIQLTDFNAKGSTASNLAKDTTFVDILKDLSSKTNDSKPEEDLNYAKVDADITPLPYGEAAGKAAHTSDRPQSAGAAGKLEIGAAKTIDVNDNRFTILRKSDTSVEVTLEPDGIGKLDIGINVEKGVITATISATDAAAKGIIEKNLHDIVNALTKEGLTVGDFTVSLKDRDGSFKDGKNENDKDKGHKVQGQIQVTQVTGYETVKYTANGGISIFA